MLALVTDHAGSPVCRILPETPAFHEALHDRALRGTPWLVYLWLYERLPDGNPYGDYRFVKQSAVAAELGIRDGGVRRALRVLVRRGYVGKAPVVGVGRIGGYRLHHRCVERVDPGATPGDPIRPETTELATA